MREIKFRGKTKIKGEWVYGHHAKLGEEDIIIVELKKTINKQGQAAVDYAFYRVEPETVGQFTGLHDKNGVEIFEGDVLSYEDVAGVKDGIGNVLFGLFYGAWIVFVDDYEENPLSDVAYSCEVIGKIHDNPELLS